MTGLSLCVNGGCTFTTDRGYASTAINQNITNNLNLSTAGNFKQNSGHFMVWQNVLGSGSAKAILQADLNNNNGLWPYNSGSILGNVNASSGFFGFARTDATGMITVSRTGSTQTDIYINNGASSASGAVASQAPSSSVVNLLSSSAEFFSGRIAAATVGAGLTAGQVASLFSRVNTYLAAIGGQ